MALRWCYTASLNTSLRYEALIRQREPHNFFLLLNATCVVHVQWIISFSGKKSHLLRCPVLMDR